MGVKRLLLILVLALSASVAIVSDAPAGVGIADEPCPTVAGENTNTCPAGTVGVAYAIQFKEAAGSGCGPGKQTFTVDSGVFPSGLTLATSGHVTGTPTEAGSFTFYVKIAEPLGEPGCAGSYGEKRFTIPINPPIPKLTLGPEQPSVLPATVGAAYSLAMTATIPDPKTWSIVDGSGSLPPGLQIGASDGLISGTPTTAGTYAFTVQATLTTDPLVSPPRSDQKALQIVVRNALVVTGPGGPGVSGMPPSELAVPFEAVLTATGGTETFLWSLTGGELPPGLALGADGTIAGRPREAGRFRFTATVTDTEVPTPRTSSFTAVINVAAKLDIVTERLRPGKAGKLYRAKLATSGGVKPTTWKVKKGPLPRGIRLDRTLGILSGTPRKAGTYRVWFEVTDELGVKSTQPLVMVITAQKKA